MRNENVVILDMQKPKITPLYSAVKIQSAESPIGPDVREDKKMPLCAVRPEECHVHCGKNRKHSDEHARDPDIHAAMWTTTEGRDLWRIWWTSGYGLL
jgi:hypothetical protein